MKLNTLYEILNNSVKNFSERIAFSLWRGGSYTYKQVGEKVAEVQELLRSAGLKKGDKVILSHAEVLDKDGNFYTDNLRSAKAQMTYILSGEKETLKPTFNFQGYRYVRFDECPLENIDLKEVYSVAVYSDMKETSHFVCGNDKINRLYQNTLWGQRSN